VAPYIGPVVAITTQSRRENEFFILEWRNVNASGYWDQTFNYEDPTMNQKITIWHVQATDKRPNIIPSLKYSDKNDVAMFIESAVTGERGVPYLLKFEHGVQKLKWLDQSESGILIRVGEVPSDTSSDVEIEWGMGSFRQAQIESVDRTTDRTLKLSGYFGVQAGGRKIYLDYLDESTQQQKSVELNPLVWKCGQIFVSRSDAELFPQAPFDLRVGDSRFHVSQ
jgi:hypothetical protein